ncbi:MAG: fructoselysine 6-kinase [Clostridiales bacterium]|nr:fructoselysine 6-kinase [Clostridiales bacterium]
MKIGCVGDNCIDYYDETGQAFPGGNPVNVAVYVRRLGGAASYVGAAGTDAYGALLVQALKDKGIDVSHVHVQPGSTAISHVTMRDGDRVFGAYDEGVLADFRPGAQDIEFLCGHDLVVSALWGHAEQAFAPIHAQGVPTAFDAAERPFAKAAQIAIPHTTLFFFSDDESDETELCKILQTLHALGPKVVVATRGSKGSLAYDGADFYRYGIVPCEVVDTMGAGDSYIAGFLMAWLEQRPIQACMEAGARNSAVTIGYSGAWQ